MKKKIFRLILIGLSLPLLTVGTIFSFNYAFGKVKYQKNNYKYSKGTKIFSRKEMESIRFEFIKHHGLWFEVEYMNGKMFHPFLSPMKFYGGVQTFTVESQTSHKIKDLRYYNPKRIEKVVLKEYFGGNKKRYEAASRGIWIPVKRPVIKKKRRK